MSEEENCTLSDLWCKSQEENKELKNKIEVYKNANEYHQNIIHELETMKQPNQLHSENVRLRAENKRLNNIINELKIILRQRGIEITIYDQPNYEKISGYVSITMTPEQFEKELKGEKQ